MTLIKQTITSLQKWPTKRWPWLVLSLSAGLLEIIALYFQYVMGLEPCVMCIYQRVAVMGVFLSALVALINPEQFYLRLIGFTGWLVSSIWGAQIAYEHVLMQDPANFMLAMSCDIYPNFPSWFAVHEWIPSIFEARGTCDGIDWTFLSLTMPNWMLITFLLYSATAITITSIKLLTTKSI